MDNGSLAASDWVSAVGATFFVTCLFCVNQVYETGGAAGVLFLLVFTFPVALAIVIIVEMPLLSFMKRRFRNFLVYIFAPFITVLFLRILAFSMSAGTFSVLRSNGVSLIENKIIRWDNFLQIIIFNLEPALWAALAGAIYWYRSIRPLIDAESAN